MDLVDFAIREETYYVEIDDELHEAELISFGKNMDLTSCAIFGFGDAIFFNFKYKFFGSCTLGSERAQHAEKVTEDELKNIANLYNIKIKHKI